MSARWDRKHACSKEKRLLFISNTMLVRTLARLPDHHAFDNSLLRAAPALCKQPYRCKCPCALNGVSFSVTLFKRRGSLCIPTYCTTVIRQQAPRIHGLEIQLEKKGKSHDRRGSQKRKKSISASCRRTRTSPCLSSLNTMSSRFPNSLLRPNLHLPTGK